MRQAGEFVAQPIKRLPNTHEIQLVVDSLTNSQLLDLEQNLQIRLGISMLLGKQVKEQLYTQLQSVIQSARIRRNL